MGSVCKACVESLIGGFTRASNHANLPRRVSRHTVPLRLWLTGAMRMRLCDLLAIRCMML